MFIVAKKSPAPGLRPASHRARRLSRGRYPPEDEDVGRYPEDEDEDDGRYPEDEEDDGRYPDDDEGYEDERRERFRSLR